MINTGIRTFHSPPEGQQGRLLNIEWKAQQTNGQGPCDPGIPDDRCGLDDCNEHYIIINMMHGGQLCQIVQQFDDNTRRSLHFVGMEDKDHLPPNVRTAQIDAPATLIKHNQTSHAIFAVVHARTAAMTDVDKLSGMTKAVMRKVAECREIPKHKRVVMLSRLSMRQYQECLNASPMTVQAWSTVTRMAQAVIMAVSSVNHTQELANDISCDRLHTIVSLDDPDDALQLINGATYIWRHEPIERTYAWNCRFVLPGAARWEPSFYRGTTDTEHCHRLDNAQTGQADSPVAHGLGEGRGQSTSSGQWASMLAGAVFQIRLDKQQHPQEICLGFSIGYSGSDKRIVIENFTKGIMSTWNDTHPVDGMVEGDFLLAVNGTKGSVGDMSKTCCIDSLLLLTVESSWTCQG